MQGATITAINLSKLDFKYNVPKTLFTIYSTINLSKLDFK